MSARPIAILLGLVVAACDRSARSRSEPWDGSADASPSRAEAPVPVGGPWITCYAHFRPNGLAARDVDRLAHGCGVPTGMDLLGATVEGQANAGFAETRVHVTAGQCLRVFAVAEPSVPALDVEVRDSKGRVLASDRNGDRWSIVNADGPFCATERGELTIRVHARAASGRFAMQVWRLP